MSIDDKTKQVCDNDSCTPDKKTAGLKAMRTLSAEVNSKKIAPMLADWNRSQSFPIPSKSNMKNVIGIGTDSFHNETSDPNNFEQKQASQDETGIFLEGLPRKRSLQLTASNASVGTTFTNEGKIALLNCLLS